MICYIQNFGCSGRASILALKLPDKFGIAPVEFFGRLAEKMPKLMQNADFLFDYANAAGTNSIQTRLNCLSMVISISKNPCQVAEARYFRYQMYVTLRKPELAKKYLAVCSELASKYKYSDMQNNIKEGFAAVDRLMKHTAATDSDEHEQASKAFLGLFS
ncbi:MAG: hypothetical protein ABFD49_01105 [Armatimonadota bacterium]|nr:hypothetical protein [bacterium]